VAQKVWTKFSSLLLLLVALIQHVSKNTVFARLFLTNLIYICFVELASFAASLQQGHTPCSLPVALINSNHEYVRCCWRRARTRILGCESCQVRAELHSGKLAVPALCLCTGRITKFSSSHKNIVWPLPIEHDKRRCANATGTSNLGLCLSRSAVHVRRRQEVR
jgi:hypothetical protein